MPNCSTVSESTINMDTLVERQSSALGEWTPFFLNGIVVGSLTARCVFRLVPPYSSSLQPPTERHIGENGGSLESVRGQPERMSVWNDGMTYSRSRITLVLRSIDRLILGQCGPLAQ